ncbi:MAG: ribosome biogenesis GTPase Der [Alphaproteobacteria bacterium]|nr:ribosome biogenesis GTPase Der [Alphaproteobacteria bacterium]
MKTVAIVGRTNVGKSTLFNRLCKKKLAIVHDEPGVTRDRKEGTAHLGDISFRLIDTAGLEDHSSLAKAMWRQTQIAIQEADVILAVVDARSGVTPLDNKMAAELRQVDKPIILLANKCEGAQHIGDFYALGLGTPLKISGEHGLGVSDLYQELKSIIAPEKDESEEEDDVFEEEEVIEEESKVKPLKLAIVGRPNVGKSTLVNQLLGQERLLTGPEAGVTRDAITIPWNWRGNEILLTDTAGLRKRGKVTNQVEEISAQDTNTSIDFAEVVILVLDANVPMEKQDLLIASKVLNEGRVLLIALNKWDSVENQHQVLNQLKEKLVESLQQVKGIPVHTISGKTGYGLDRMMSDVFEMYKLWNKRVPTHKLNTFLQEMTQAHPTPVASNGRRIPMKYMTQVSKRPPTFVIFSSNPDQLPESYLRYLSNGLRERYGLVGVPIRIHMRKRENPYAEKAKERASLKKKAKIMEKKQAKGKPKPKSKVKQGPKSLHREKRRK